MKRWLILMTKHNLAKCESGEKTMTRRDTERLSGIKAGDQIFFRSNYKTTYATASGPYIADKDAFWEDLQDITAEDSVREGIDPKPHKCGCEPCSMTSKFCPATTSSIIMYFRELWESIYKRQGVRWEDNPRVLVIGFNKHRA